MTKGVNDMQQKDIIEYNRMTWDKQVDGGQSDWIKPVSNEEIEKARSGEFKVGEKA